MEKDWTQEEEAARLAARFADGVNRAEFARRFNVPGGGSAIYQNITARRPISFDAAVAYARGFNCTLAEISPRLARLVEQANALPAAGARHPYQTIHEPSTTHGVREPEAVLFPQTAPQPIRHHLPVISWGDALMVHKLYESGAVFQLPQTAYAGDAAGRRLVVLIQDDDSMTANSAGTSFPPGTEYVIDIDRPPSPGDYVLVPGEHRAFLRQLVADATGLKLRPLNQQFDHFQYTQTWIGTLIEARLPIFKAG